ncbi:hypothetical protein ES703_84826 [subsurface metagenome]
MTHFYNKSPDPKDIGLTSTGAAAKEVADFCFNRCPDRGESYNPVGIILEHKHGYEPRPHTNFRGRGPWYVLERGEGEWEIERFWQAVYPGHSEIPDPAGLPSNATPMDRESHCLHESVLGDPFDVLTDRCPEEVMARYPRLMTLGPKLLASLKRYVRAGGELLVNAAHLSDRTMKESVLGVTFGDWIYSSKGNRRFWIRRVKPTTARVVLADSKGNPMILENEVGKGRVILVTVKHSLTGKTIGNRSRYLPDVLDFMKTWIAPVYPVRVETTRGHAPHYALNKLSDGWLVTVGNHYGSAWSGTVTLAAPAVTRVKELWTQSAIRHEPGEGELKFRARVPQYSFRVFRCRRA